MKSIGIIGRRRVGKDTLAAFLVEHGYTRIGFADALKEAALAVDPIVSITTACACNGDEEDDVTRLSDLVEWAGWERAKDEYPEVRRILQRLGDEAGRQVHGDNTWVNIVLRKITTLSTPVVVPDVRYPNEVRALRDVGFLIVKIVRGSVTRGGIVDAHSSESNADIMEADLELSNNGELCDLFEAARNELAL